MKKHLKNHLNALLCCLFLYKSKNSPVASAGEVSGVTTKMPEKHNMKMHICTKHAHKSLLFKWERAVQRPQTAEYK